MSKKFTEDHEWASREGDVVTIGITTYAQEQLGEIVYVELPDVDRELGKAEEAAVIESVKAAGELKSPVAGVVSEVNETLNDAPETVNAEPEGDGWIYKVTISDDADFDALMDADAYQALVDSLA